MTPSELDALAQKLKLSKRQRLFCEILAKSDKAQGSQVEAMRAAGYKGKDNVLYTGGSKMVRLAKVQSYLKALTESAVEAVRKRTGGTIMTLGEALVGLTRQANGQEPTETRQYRGPGETRVVKRFAMRDARVDLVRYHTGEYAKENAPPKPPMVINVQVNLETLTTEEKIALRAMRAKVLNGAGEGHGGNGKPGNGAAA